MCNTCQFYYYHLKLRGKILKSKEFYDGKSLEESM